MPAWRRRRPVVNDVLRARIERVRRTVVREVRYHDDEPAAAILAALQTTTRLFSLKSMWMKAVSLTASAS